MSKYAIRLGNEPIWFTDGKEDLFNTEEEAIQAIAEEIVICEEAEALGYMEDSGSFEDYRIVEIAS